MAYCLVDGLLLSPLIEGLCCRMWDFLYVSTPVVILVGVFFLSNLSSRNGVIFFFNTAVLGLFILALLWLSYAEMLLSLCFSPFELWIQGFEPIINTRRGLNAGTSPLVAAELAFLFSGAVTGVIFFVLTASKPQAILAPAILSLIIILASGFVFITSESLITILISFEMLLLASLYLLRLTSKSERVAEASAEMFFWTLMGSLALLTVFSWLYAKGLTSLVALLEQGQLNTAATLLCIVGFGVKVPVWPFFSWLLKAHVEASVEFSILLSGFIVKVGVYGVYRILLLSASPVAMLALSALCVIGLIIATLRLVSQRDLKRIVATTTIIEMNWLGLCLALGGAVLEQTALYLVAVHSLITSLEFLVVEAVSKRYGTRDLTQLNGLFVCTPLLATVAFCTTLITIGFPGTPLFFAKVVFFQTTISLSWGLTAVLAVLLLLLVPLFFMRIWVPVWFGSARLSVLKLIDLTSLDLILFACLLGASMLVAFWPALLIWF